MLERLLITFSLILLGWFAFRLFKRLQLRRRRGRTLGLPGFQADVAAILYFTTPGCAPCRTIQRPALASLKERFGSSINIIQIDATKHPSLADGWGVLSVPTTFIIDPQGRPRGVNHGVARLSKLESQLQAIGVEPAQGVHSSQPRLAHSREI